MHVNIIIIVMILIFVIVAVAFGLSSVTTMTPSRIRLDVGCCKLPGCSNPCHIDPESEKIFDFCCRSHGRMDIALKQQEALKSGLILATEGINGFRQY